MDMKTFKIIESNLYLEMKIKFSANDALCYFYNKANTELFMRNEKKDLGAIVHLLSEYSKISFMDAIDFLLYLIDYSADQGDISCTSLFELVTRYVGEVYLIWQKKCLDASCSNLNKIIHR